MDVDPPRRRNEGLQEVFTGVFPISDPRELFSLEFVAYDIGEPKYSMDECLERDLTFSAPLKATLRLLHARGGGRRQARQGRDRAGSLSRRAAAHHRQAARSSSTAPSA